MNRKQINTNYLFPNIFRSVVLLLAIISLIICTACKPVIQDQYQAKITREQESPEQAGDSRETDNKDNAGTNQDDEGNSSPEEELLRLEQFNKLLEEITGQLSVNYSHMSLEGNKVTSLKGDIFSAGFIDIKLNGTPVWIVSSSMGRSSLWTVMLDDGSMQVFQLIIDDNPSGSSGSSGLIEDKYNIYEIEENIPTFDSPTPPVLISGDEDFKILDNEFYNNNLLTNPVFIGPPFRSISITPTGALEILGQEYGEYDINAIPDGRIIFDDEGLTYIFTDPSNSYPHGILGDTYEANRVMILDSKDSFDIISHFDIGKNDVIESLYPMIYDLDQDGSNEIIVTLSNSSNGARIAVFDQNGVIVAEGPSVGTGMRWRHQIAVAPFGPRGEIELVDVLTPHIGGIVEFYRFQNKQLEIVSTIKGYSSHQIGSRNLDMALAGDFDDDGQFEVLIPTQDFSKLGLLQHSITGARLISSIDAGGKISTNLSAADGGKGNIMLGVGREDGFLRIWITEE